MNNNHKKDFQEDKFARHYYCKHARLNQLRSDKKRSERATRRKNKKLLKNLLTNATECGIIARLCKKQHASSGVRTARIIDN